LLVEKRKGGRNNSDDDADSINSKRRRQSHGISFDVDFTMPASTCLPLN